MQIEGQKIILSWSKLVNEIVNTISSDICTLKVLKRRSFVELQLYCYIELLSNHIAALRCGLSNELDDELQNFKTASWELLLSPIPNLVANKTLRIE